MSNIYLQWHYTVLFICFAIAFGYFFFHSSQSLWEPISYSHKTKYVCPPNTTLLPQWCSEFVGDWLAAILLLTVCHLRRVYGMMVCYCNCCLRSGARGLNDNLLLWGGTYNTRVYLLVKYSGEYIWDRLLYESDLLTEQNYIYRYTSVYEKDTDF